VPPTISSTARPNHFRIRFMIALPKKEIRR
jgi:hypothetical protein